MLLPPPAPTDDASSTLDSSNQLRPPASDATFVNPCFPSDFKLPLSRDTLIHQPVVSESSSGDDAPSKRRKQDTTKRFQCPHEACDAVFSRTHNLQVHIQSVHLGLRPHACTEPGCSRAFSRKQDLVRHHRSAHTTLGSPRNMNDAKGTTVKGTKGDWKLYAAGVLYFSGNCALAGIQGFLPTIIPSFGFADTVAQILTVPPYAAAAVILFSTMYISDRLQRRGVFLAGAGTILAGCGYILLLAFPSHDYVRYFAASCTCAGTVATIALVLTWFSHKLGLEKKKAAGMLLYMCIGQCGSILGSHLFPKTDAPRYMKGFAVTCGLQFLSVVVAGVLITYYAAKNRRRDASALYGKPALGAPVDSLDLAEKAPDFGYTPSSPP